MSLPNHASQAFIPIEYPSSDGKPMADNTKQARWIIMLYNNLHGLFQHENVFIAADLLWYPLEGDPKTCQAPDVMLAFGRPKGDRPSYQQWKEGGIAPQVVFEVLSPGNTPMEMFRKQAFYQRHGVEELILIEPGRKEGDPESFLPYLRQQDQLSAGDFDLVDWISPRLGVRFRQQENRVQLFYPDGSPFQSFEAIQAERDRARQEAESEKQRAEAEKQRADHAEAEIARLRKLLDKGEE